MGFLTLPIPVAVKPLGKKRKERRKRESLRDQRIVSQVLVRSLNPTVDGSDLRTLEITGKLQILQQIAVPNNGKGKLNPTKGSPIYVGINTHPSGRIEVIEDKSDKKEQKGMMKNDSGIGKVQKMVKKKEILV